VLKAPFLSAILEVAGEDSDYVRKPTLNAEHEEYLSQILTNVHIWKKIIGKRVMMLDVGPPPLETIFSKS
jgi:hypothetical protein